MNAADLKTKIETALAEAKIRDGYDYAVLLCEARQIDEAMPRLLNLDLSPFADNENDDEEVNCDADRFADINAACINALGWMLAASDCIRAFPATFEGEDRRRREALGKQARELIVWTHSNTQTGDDDIDSAAHSARMEIFNRI